MTSTPTADPRSAPFGRVLTAMVTPFDDDGAVDLTAAQQLATHLVRHGHDGLVLSGTTGESPTTTDAEKAALVRAVVAAVGPDVMVVAGVGTNDTRHSVELAGQAAAAGARGLLVVTPYYSCPPQAGVLAHFRAVADATELPVMLYDIPGRTGLALTPPTLAGAAEHPRIVAVKDATGDLHAGSWVMARTDLAYYSGDDAANLAWLAHGAAGVVSVVGHVAGPQYAAMVQAVDRGDLVTARRLHRELLPTVRGIMTRTQGAIMAKAALQLRGLLASRAVRLPLVPATDDEVALLTNDLSESALLEANA
jgi:4-hydroxy-tetrahydrodipicolinate synthase